MQPFHQAGCFSCVKQIRKEDLPVKTCPVCQRPFNWRKKWARDWERVVYCSERCRRSGKTGK